MSLQHYIDVLDKTKQTTEEKLQFLEKLKTKPQPLTKDIYDALILHVMNSIGKENPVIDSDASSQTEAVPTLTDVPLPMREGNGFELTLEQLKLIRSSFETDRTLTVEPSDFQLVIDTFISLLEKLTTTKSEFSLPSDMMRTMVTSIVSSTFSLISSLYSLVTTSDNAVNATLQSVTIAAALTHLANCIYVACKHWNIAYNLVKAKTIITKLATELLRTKANAKYSEMAIIPKALGILVSVLLAGTALCNTENAKHIVHSGAILRAIKVCKTDAESITEWICEDLLGMDLRGDINLYEDIIALAKRSTELLIPPTYEFITKGELKQELREFPTKATTAITKVMHSNSKAKALTSAKTLLVHNISAIREKLAAIRAVEDQVPRIETVGVLLAGAAGVGKSTLVRLLTNKLAERFDYQNTLYNMNKQANGFALPYGGQAFGVYNEFMAARAENDGILKEYNNFVSSDPANFESAHLEGKCQPCMLKALFLTCNQIRPKLTSPTGGISSEAETAFWDRTMTFEIKDPLVQGRQGDNSHRRPDYSHLTVTVHPPDRLENRTIVKQQPYDISVDEMIDMVAAQMKIRELRFLSQYAPQDEASLQRKVYLEHMETIPRQVTSNAGRNYFVIRLQGTAGTGKTHLALEIAKMYKSHFKQMPIIEVCTLKRPPINNQIPAIYVIDDLIYTPESKIQYFHWINELHPMSLVLLATNEIITKGYVFTRDLPLMTKCYKISQLPYLPDGYARRIGLPSLVQYGNSMVTPATNTGITIDMKRNYMIHVDETAYTKEQLLQLCFESYVSYAENSNGILRKFERYAQTVEPEILIKSKSLSSICTMLSSTQATLRAFLNNDPDTTITVSQNFVKAANGQTYVKDWLIENDNLTITQLLDTAERLYASARRIKPDTSICFQITNLIEIICKNSIMYVYLLSEELDLPITERDGKIYVADIPICPDTFANYAVCGVVAPDLLNIPQEIILAIRNRIELSQTPICLHYANVIKLLELQTRISLDIKARMAMFISQNKLLTLCGIMISSYVIYRIGKYSYDRLFGNSSEKSTHTKANGDSTFSPSDQDPTDVKSMKSKLRESILTGNKAMRMEVYEQARQHSQDTYERLNDYEYNLRSNSLSQDYVNHIVDTKDVSRLKQLIDTSPDDLITYLCNRTQSNMLTSTETKFSQRTLLDKFMAKLSKSYVSIYSHTKNAYCYGIAIGGRKIVTVSHMFKAVGETLTVMESGRQYTAIVSAISRPRDLAFITVESLDWIPQRKLNKFFINDKNDMKLDSTWYVRISDTQPMAVKTTHYFKKIAQLPLSDIFNPDFSLSRDYFITDFVRNSDMKMIIRDGDCGMPLLALCGNEIRIVGIHNSYDRIDASATFSALDQIDLSLDFSNATTVEFDKPDVEWLFVNPITSETTIAHPLIMKGLKDMETSRFDKLAVKPWGYSRQLHLRSNPKHSKFYQALPKDLDLPRLKKPSALIYGKWMDASDLVTDNYGNPHTLFTQANFYANRTPDYGQWNPEHFEHAQQIILLRYKRDYGTLKPLNMKEILNGLQNLRGIELDTSPGPILKHLYGLVDKSKIFVNKAPEGKPPFFEIASNQFGEAFKEMFYNYDKALLNGIPVTILSKDNAKVELISVEKADKGGVRLFNELCVSFNSVLKKYFGCLLDKCQSQWHLGPYAFGANHYLLGKWINSTFDFQGTVQNTDYSKFDKTIPPELIKSFCEVALHYLPPKVAQAFAHSLTYVLHTLDGHIYMVKSGNESGTYVTTLLNCYVVEFVNAYTCIEKFYEKYGKYPSLDNLELIYKQYICGDDATLKVRGDFFTMEDRVRVNSMFNMKLTPAKVESEVPSFCSREMYVDPLKKSVTYPALKKSSIISCLMYFADLDPELISLNCNVALFEASLHDKEFFEKVNEAVIYLYKKHRLPNVNWYLYEQYRQAFVSYVEGYENSPFSISQFTMPTEGQNDLNKISNSTHLLRKLLQQQPELFEHSDYIQHYLQTVMDSQAYLNHYQQIHSTPAPGYESSKTGPEEQPVWTTVISMQDAKGQLHTSTGIAPTKKGAKKMAADFLAPILMRDSPSYVKEPFLKFQNQLVKDEKFTIDAKSNSADNSGPVPIVAIHNDAIGQAASNAMVSTLPTFSNPQPSEVAPSLAPPGEEQLSNEQVTGVTGLNTLGPPNLLNFGAIDFDLKTLVYTQFLDSDQTVAWTEDLTAGTILAQIPYDPLNRFMNPYMKLWASMHERYTGEIFVRITLMGNPLYSGILGVGWFPRKQTGTVVKLSEFMKIAYQGKGVTEPWTNVYRLHDARKQWFYREIGDADIDNRPHLVICPLVTVENPLRDGVTVRMRIATKFANPRESTNPWISSYPNLPITETPSPSNENFTPELPGYNGYPLKPFINNLVIYSDGARVHPLILFPRDTYFNYSEYVQTTALAGCAKNDYATSATPRSFNMYQYGTELPVDLPEITTDTCHIALHISGDISSIALTRFMKEINTNLPTVTETWVRLFDSAYNNTVSSITNMSSYYIARTSLYTQLVLYRSGKLVTEFGTIYVKWYNLYYSESDISPTNAQKYLSLPQVQSDEENLFARPYAPVVSADLTLSAFNAQTTLPSGTQSLVFTTIPASALGIAGFLNPTASNSAQFVEFVKTAAGIYDPSTQAIQIIGKDVRNLATIFVARFLDATNDFYIKPLTLLKPYAKMPIDIENISLSVGVVNKSLEFPLTDNTTWIDRSTTTFVLEKKMELQRLVPNQLAMKELTIDANSNALLAGLTLAGGAASGIGGAMGNLAGMKFQKDIMKMGMNWKEGMQQKQFSQDILMQANQFAQQSFLQGNALGSQQYMQDRELGTRQRMQQEEFSTRKEMQRADQDFQYKMKGYSNPSVFY